jgi:GH24 family phage-related lysozyme (muramidase)
MENQKPTATEKLKDTFSSLFRLKQMNPESVGVQFSTSRQALGEIYKLMVDLETERKLRSEIEERYNQLEQMEMSRRNREIIKALTGREVKVPEVKQEPEKDTEVKKKSSKKTSSKSTIKKPKLPSIPSKTTTTKTASVKTKVGTITKDIPKKLKQIGTSPIVQGVAAVGLVAGASSVIAKEEGLAIDKKTGLVAAYWDPPSQKNLVSIGYGHQIQDYEYKQGYIEAGDERIKIEGNRGIDTRMTSDQAKKLLDVDLPKYEKRARDPLGDAWNKLSEPQKTALISYAYNTGSTASLVKQGLKEAIDNGNMNKAADIIREKGIKTASGVYSPQLDQRRQREAAIFQSGIDYKPLEPASPTIGNTIDTSSKENKDLKKKIEENSTVVKNTLNVNQTNSTTTTPQSRTEKFDDRPAMLKKG